LFHDEGFVLVDDFEHDGLDFSGQVLGGFLDLFPCSLQLVLDSVSFGSRYSTGGSSDDTDDFVFDLEVDFLSSINDNGLGFVQSFDNLGFEFLDLGKNVVPDISVQFLGGSSGFLVDIIGIFHDLDTEFVDADMDFLGFIDDEVFVVFNIITEFVQSFNDSWLVFFNLGLDELINVGTEVLDGGLNFVPNIIGIFDDLDSEFVDANVDFLALLNNKVFVVFNVFLEFVQSFDDLWFVFLDLVLNVLISTSHEVVECSLDLSPDSLQVSDDFNSLCGGLDVQFLGSINNNFFESVQVSLGICKSIQDLGLEHIHLVVEVILDFFGGRFDGILDLVPDIHDSTFIHVGNFFR